MSQLSPEQHSRVERWAADGATLNQIQDNLKSEFGINLTYMEARLLLLETGTKIKDKPREVEKPATPEPEILPPEPETESWPVGGDEDAPAAIPGAAASSLTLSLDQIAIPGAMVSGKANFSDGQTASWYLDQTGRLGLANVPPGYQPPKADIPQFQRELDRLLQQSGF